LVDTEALQRELWSLAGTAVSADPVDSAPRLYVETLNEMIDAHSDRVASLRNRVPLTVLALQVFGSAIALGALALYLALLGRGLLTSLVATVVVLLILFVSFDLDRPNRGLITVPDQPLVEARASMDPPPAFPGPRSTGGLERGSRAPPAPGHQAATPHPASTPPGRRTTGDRPTSARGGAPTGDVRHPAMTGAA
jgi:hypothetical protein